MEIKQLPLLFMVVAVAAAACACPGKQGASPGKPAGNPPAQPAFVLDLEYVKEEQSKDSSTDTYKILVRDHHAQLAFTHQGFPEDESKNKTYGLHPKALAGLKAFVHKHKLQRDLTEKKPANDTGMSVKLRLKITEKGKTTTLRIHGQTYAWDAREGKGKSNLEHKDLADLVGRIVSMIENQSPVI